MKAFDRIKETVEDPKFIQGVQIAVVAGATAITVGLAVYAKGFQHGWCRGLIDIDSGFRQADPEAYAKLLDKANALVQAGIIH